MGRHQCRSGGWRRRRLVAWARSAERRPYVDSVASAAAASGEVHGDVAQRGRRRLVGCNAHRQPGTQRRSGPSDASAPSNSPTSAAVGRRCERSRQDGSRLAARVLMASLQRLEENGGKLCPPWTHTI
jgi:hypothetical protein